MPRSCGSGFPRELPALGDLSAIQGEIDQLGRRQSILEDAQIAAMEALEAAQAEVDRLAAQEQEIRASGRELTATRDAEFARLDQEIEQTSARRAELAGTIDAALLAEYNAARAATGGIGAIGPATDAGLRGPSRSVRPNMRGSRLPRRTPSSMQRPTTSFLCAWRADPAGPATSVSPMNPANAVALVMVATAAGGPAQKASGLRGG